MLLMIETLSYAVIEYLLCIIEHNRVKSIQLG